jgi:hypothetical protein
MAARTALGAAGTMQQASYGGQRISIHRLTPVRYTAQHHPPAVGAARGRTFDVVRYPKVGLFVSNAGINFRTVEC